MLSWSGIAVSDSYFVALVDLCEAYHHDLEYDRHQPLLFKLFNKPPILIQEGQQ